MEKLIDIKTPCHENWETMKIGLNSRFCDNCEKNVIDFTNKDRNEILEYLFNHRNEKVCGRFYRSQLDFSNTDFLVTIEALAKKHKNTNLSFYLLTIGTLLLTSCDNKPVEKTITKSETKLIPSDSTDTQVKEKPQQDTIDKSAKTQQNNPPEIPERYELGEVAYPDFNHLQVEPYVYADVMPEFKGGIESLNTFIKQNLVYPNWERENNIQGKVVVNFVVDKNGKIKDGKILSTVQGAKNFDKEVLRLINSMPNWIPGQQDGKKVDVQFNLPIDFKL